MHKLTLLMNRLTSVSDQNNLIELMVEGLTYAKSDNIASLELWLNIELNGYGYDYIYSNHYYNNIVSESHLEYRNTRFEAKQVFGLNIRTFFNRVPDMVILFSGVIEIEKYIKHNQPIVFQNDYAEPWASNKNHDWSDVTYKIKFQPKDLETTLNKIRIEYINKIREIILQQGEFDDSNSSKSVIENIEHLITIDDMENALSLISEKNPDVKNDTIMLLAKLSNIRKQLINITIKQDDYQIEISKVRAAALQLLNTIRNME